MEVGIVGLPGSGKTTLFNAITGMAVEGFSDKPHVGVGNIPDPRLETIAEHIPTQKLVPATIKLVDIPGVPVGSDAKKLNAVLEQIRQVDALCHVVRCFDDGTGPVDAAGAVEQMDVELVLADLVVAEGALDKATRTARSGDRDAKARVEVLGRVTEVLSEERPIRAVTDWSEAERAALKSYGFVSALPVLYVANVDEDDTAGTSDQASAVRALAAASNGGFVAVCAKLEAELAELDDADRTEMLSSLGLDEPAIGPLARTAHAVLGLTTFYTAGEKEVRAWTIYLGASAPVAAGAIHSDIQRGFIRAECYHIDDLVALKSEKAIREAGKLRSEGKHYAMQDGDVVNFLFNV
jgi:GTP-binding protein YchF